MKSFILITLLMTSMALRADHSSNVDADGVMLSGFNAVSYFESDAPTKGSQEFKVKLKDEVYLFATKANQEKFKSNPEKYKPLYGGWCAYAVADSKSKVEADPKSFVIQDGKLLLFYNGFWGDTKAKWSKEPDDFYKKANLNWPEVH